MTLNAYERRKADRQAKTKRNAVREAELRAIQRDRLMKRYEDAYKEYHGKSITVVFERARFTVGKERVTYSELEGMVLLLQARLHERYIGGLNAQD